MSHEDEQALDALERNYLAEYVREHAPTAPIELQVDTGPYYFRWVVSVCLDWYDRGSDRREAAGQLFIYLMNKHVLLRRLCEAGNTSGVLAALTYGREQFEGAMRCFCPDAPTI